MSDSLITIERYSPRFEREWDNFVESSKNGTFLFNRSYMDYHADRFIDHSLLIYRKEKLYCLLPANRRDNVLYSHQGLTYGGLVMSDKCTTEGILDVFNSLMKFLPSQGISKWIYKPVPYIYHRLPADEDLYALFRNDACLNIRNVSSTIDLCSRLRFNKDRREAERRAIRNNLYVKETADYSGFWVILKENLHNTYGASPVHSLDEILSLSKKFPDNIKLFGSFIEDTMMAGMVVFITSTTIHAQYISASPEGKKKGAVDLIVAYLLDNYLPKEKDSIKWFDLGTSNEDGGRVLNESLIYQKEGFGGRAVCYDTYELEIPAS